MGDIDQDTVDQLLSDVGDPAERNKVAAALSKVAAKADDDILMQLSIESGAFVSWLADSESLVKAYAACILANIAFLAEGQAAVSDVRGVPVLVNLLKEKGLDKKVTLHSTAAVQNLTYKNTQCCQEVIEHGGEKALKRLLNHKSEDVQQFAAGALANLQLYRRKDDGGGGGGNSKSNKKGGLFGIAKKMGRKQHGGGGGGGGGGGSPRGDFGGGPDSSGGGAGDERNPFGFLSERGADEAAATIQAIWRGTQGRRQFEAKRRKAKKGKSKYNTFQVSEVRAELGAIGMGGGLGGGSGGGLSSLGGAGGGLGGGGLGGPSGPGFSLLRQVAGPGALGGGAGRLPARLAPLSSHSALPTLGTLPQLPHPGGPPMMPMPARSIGGGGFGGGSGFGGGGGSGLSPMGGMPMPPRGL